MTYNELAQKVFEARTISGAALTSEDLSQIETALRNLDYAFKRLNDESERAKLQHMRGQYAAQILSGFAANPELQHTSLNRLVEESVHAANVLIERLTK